MSDELDLERGDVARAERILGLGKEAGPSRTTAKKPAAKSTTSRKTGDSEDGSLKSDLLEMFHDFAEQFAERDPELADVLTRRRDAMSQGLVGFTRKVPPLRRPLKVVVAFFQPTLAFWELGSLLIGRAITRRQRREAEYREQQNGQPNPTDITGNSTDHGYA